MMSPKKLYELFKKLEFKNLIWSVEDLLNPITSIGEINYKPPFQRNYVWDDHKATFYTETIFLGLEVPPFILLKSKDIIDIIDGRQRYETLLRFYNNKFHLHSKGLLSLKKFSNMYFKDLTEEIQVLFMNSTTRTITITPKEDEKISDEEIDLVKRAIFIRYNMGISSLKEVEVEKAKYLNNDIIKYFKEYLTKNERIIETFANMFLPLYSKKSPKNPELLERVIKKIRFLITIDKFKINHYAKSNNKIILSDAFFAAMRLNENDIKQLYNDFESKIELLNNIKIHLELNNIPHTQYIFDCIYWALSVLKKENITVKNSDCAHFVKELGLYIKNNLELFNAINAHYRQNVLKRYSVTAKFFENYFNINLAKYFNETEEYKKEVDMLFSKDPKQILNDHLKDHMLNKTRPEDYPLELVLKMLNRNNYILQPPYQRVECMNTKKASRLIESLLLDFKIPPIFVYVRRDNTREIIDGQQRLLAFLGFLSKTYTDELGNEKKSAKHNFRLNGMEILTDWNGKTFDKLPKDAQDKIKQAPIPIVEICELRHPKFDPVDLFIRLNSKPYPIKMHSFEMWNTLMPQKFSNIIKDNTDKHSSWFYLRAKSANARMLNEEFYTTILFLESHDRPSVKKTSKYLKFHPQFDCMISAVRHKDQITNFLSDLSCDSDFSIYINKTESYINKLKLLLNDPEEKDPHGLKKRLDNLMCDNSKRRSLKMLYTLWYLVSPLKIKTIKEKRSFIIKNIKKILQLFVQDIDKTKENKDSVNTQLKMQFELDIAEYQKKFLTHEREKIKPSGSYKESKTKIKPNKYGSINAFSIEFHHNKNAKIKFNNA